MSKIYKSVGKCLGQMNDLMNRISFGTKGRIFGTETGLG